MTPATKKLLEEFDALPIRIGRRSWPNSRAG